MEIQGKQLKDILKSQREEYQRYLGVLAESLTGTQEQLVALREMVAKNTEDIIKIQAQLVAIREMVAKNTEDIEIMGMDLHVIKDDLIEKISREEFKIIEKRVDLLEKKFQKA